MAAKKKAPYGYRRVWLVPLPPTGNWGRPNNEGRRQAARMHKDGPRLFSVPVQPARTSPLRGDKLDHWDGTAGSNWDFYPASILVSVQPTIEGPSPQKRLRFAPEHQVLRGMNTSLRGVGFSVAMLVTRGGRDLHREQRLDLAAALRDAAELLERQ